MSVRQVKISCKRNRKALIQKIVSIKTQLKSKINSKKLRIKFLNHRKKESNKINLKNIKNYLLISTLELTQRMMFVIVRWMWRYHRMTLVSFETHLSTQRISIRVLSQLCGLVTWTEIASSMQLTQTSANKKK